MYRDLVASIIFASAVLVGPAEGTDAVDASAAGQQDESHARAGTENAEGELEYTRQSVLRMAKEVFPKEDTGTIMSVLDQYGIEPYEKDRVPTQEAILNLSKGEVEKLHEAVRIFKGLAKASEENAVKFTRQLVLKKAKEVFPNEDTEKIITILDRYGVEPYEKERERVQLGILKLSDSQIDKLHECVRLAKQDYRDVLIGAEYPLDTWPAIQKVDAKEVKRLTEQNAKQYLDWLYGHPDAFRSEAARLELRKPSGWRFQSLESLLANRATAKMKEEEFQKAVEQMATVPVVVATKHEEPYNKLNPSFQVILRPAGTLEGKTGAEILRVVEPTLKAQFAEFRTVGEIRDTAVAGQPAARMTARYIVRTRDGRQFPTQATFVMVPRGKVLYQFSFTASPEGPDAIGAEVDAVLASVRFVE